MLKDCLVAANQRWWKGKGKPLYGESGGFTLELQAQGMFILTMKTHTMSYAQRQQPKINQGHEQ